MYHLSSISHSADLAYSTINLSHCVKCTYNSHGWLCGPAVEHWSLADVLSLSCSGLVADG